MLAAFVPDWATRVVVYLEPINMRWGADKLHTVCEENIGISPATTTLFMFTNRAQDSLLMYWKSGGEDQVLIKKLLKGTFLLPARPSDGAKFVTMSPKIVPRLFRS